MNPEKARTYCYSCGAEIDGPVESLLPTCGDCAAQAREGEPVYAVLHADSRAEGQLSSSQVVDQIRRGLITAEDHVAGRGSTYVRLDQHADFAPYFIPSDPRRAGLLEERASEASEKASRRRGRAMRSLLRVAAALLIVGVPVGLWKAGLLSMENPIVARIAGWVDAASEQASRTFAKAVDEDVAKRELEARTGLPADALLTALQEKWPELPGDAEERMELAQVGLLQGTREGLDSARSELEAAFVLAPRSIEAISLLAIVYAELGDNDPELRRGGLELFQRASKLNPESPFVMRANAGMALSSLAYEEAAGKARQCIKASNNDPFCSWYLGQALVELGSFEEAAAALQVAAEAFDDAPVVNLSLGRAAMESHHYPQAEAALQAFAARYPDDPGIHKHLARLDHLLGRDAEALEHARLAVKYGPDIPDGRLLLGQLLTHVHGQHAEAADVLRPLFEVEPANNALRDEALLHASIAARRAGRADDAVRAAERLCNLRPRWPPAQLALALAHELAGDSAAAEAALDFDDTADSAEVASRARVEAARYWDRQGRDRGMQLELEAARDLRPAWPLVQLELARAYLRFGNVDGALDAVLEISWMDARRERGFDLIRPVPVGPMDLETFRTDLVASATGSNDAKVLAAVATLESFTCLRYGERCGEADMALEAGLERLPESDPLHLMAAQMRIDGGKPELAMDHIAALVGPEEHPTPLALEGQAHAAQGQRGDVDKSFAKALAMPDDGSALRWRYAEALSLLGDTEGAIEQAREGVEETPRNLALRRTLNALYAGEAAD
ncbi:MAG: tetratricopeptide repeat protein [Alphaproteobacteria bacterium]|nr:tetratricopeptide repeat protein [Alphaproteobacteria bacterium]